MGNAMQKKKVLCEICSEVYADSFYILRMVPSATNLAIYLCTPYVCHMIPNIVSCNDARAYFKHL